MRVCIPFFLLFAVILHVSGEPSEFPYPENDSVRVISFYRQMQKLEREVMQFVHVHPDSTFLHEAIVNSITLPPRVIRIISVGDVMPGTNYPGKAYLPRSCEALFRHVKPVLNSGDLSIGNLEGVFSSSGGTPKNCKDPKTCYVFRMPDSYAVCLKNAGFDIMGVANNHVNDFGYQGRMNTVQVLEKEGIAFAGFPSHSYCSYSVKGLEIAYCAFAPHTGTLNFKDYDAAAALVKDLKCRHDIVILGFHAGAEGSKHQHITRKDEVFLGHNRGNPWLFARKVIDAGADLVVGHGPHVVRAIDFYKGKLIAYSLGNFCTYARFNLRGPNANAPVLDVTLDEYGNFQHGRIHSFLQLGEGGPLPDSTKQAFRKIESLTHQDFPDLQIVFQDDGSFFPSGE